MGFETRFDYADFGGGIDDRLGHCYMLAGKALLTHFDHLGHISHPVALIHGTMHGPNATARIGHAIVLLNDGRVWEPVTAGVYDRAKFESYARWRREQIYKVNEARELMLSTGTYGPWLN